VNKDYNTADNTGAQRTCLSSDNLELQLEQVIIDRQ